MKIQRKNGISILKLFLGTYSLFAQSPFIFVVSIEFPLKGLHFFFFGNTLAKQSVTHVRDWQKFISCDLHTTEIACLPYVYPETLCLDGSVCHRGFA